ncbi:MAG TPA: glutathione gamma-glutamylcysteinyltransferase [Cyanobacteria bacterium UBA8803]|nr:glutathione gamma-glutamylcysteinyltransferase [Cyanobacteria bacterium UBA9273]HBL61013.1 glutathione gamma-glutamylcysteinyltransferase [Cyanobacteria bacterium UBA8803]
MNSSKYQIGLLKAIAIPLQAIILGLCLVSEGVLSQTLPVSQNLINLNSREGEELLIESEARQDYMPLSIHFETQDNLAYCGVASIVMVLNSLSIPAPIAPEFGTYHRFTQKNFFNAQTERVLPAEVAARQGMTLDQLGQLLATYPVKVQVYHASEVTLEEFRNQAIKNLREPGNFILINYLRKTIGQETGGHISPLAAYNQQTDRFLILDVSRYKYPPVWVKAEELWQAMATIDSASGKMRGFVLVASAQ